MALVPTVVDRVSGTPVIAAGGIADGRGLAAAMALGASGAWIGTRFLASPEAAIHSRYRDLLLAAKETDTEYGTSFDVHWLDAPHRTLRNAPPAAVDTGSRRPRPVEVADLQHHRGSIWRQPIDRSARPGALAGRVRSGDAPGAQGPRSERPRRSAGGATATRWSGVSGRSGRSGLEAVRYGRATRGGRRNSAGDRDCRQGARSWMLHARQRLRLAGRRSGSKRLHRGSVSPGHPRDFPGTRRGQARDAAARRAGGVSETGPLPRRADSEYNLSIQTLWPEGYGGTLPRRQLDDG